MRALVLSIFLIFAACAAPSTETSPSQRSNTTGQHIPPPDFPASAPEKGKICGGMTATPQSCTGENEYCHRNIEDICGAADAPGHCRPKPAACTMDYNPVCGCDGKTYPNECAANANGVSAASMGECTG